MRASQRRQARQALDERLRKLERSALAAPRMGWIRAIRDALGLSTRQLADRLGISGAAVTGLEASERAGTIQLDTLRRIAAAMECEVVYALVPRGGSLEAVVLTRAEQAALVELNRLNTTMRLEDQGLDARRLNAALVDLTHTLQDSTRIWDEPLKRRS